MEYRIIEYTDWTCDEEDHTYNPKKLYIAFNDKQIEKYLNDLLSKFPTMSARYVDEKVGIEDLNEWLLKTIILSKIKVKVKFRLPNNEYILENEILNVVDECNGIYVCDYGRYRIYVPQSVAEALE